jgi:hypothetical protein
VGPLAASDQRGNNSKRFEDFYLKALKTFRGLLLEGQGQNLALTVLHVPYSLNSGTRKKQQSMPSRILQTKFPGERI